MKNEIERKRWQDYLNDFSKRNEGRPARIELIGEEIGAQQEAERLPLVGVSFELRGSETGNAEITLAGLSAADSRYLRHVIVEPIRIVPKTGEDGREDGLEFESADGTKTILILEELLELAEDNNQDRKTAGDGD